MNRSERIQVRVTPEERKAIDVARGRLPISAWVRELIMEAAERGNRKVTPRLIAEYRKLEGKR